VGRAVRTTLTVPHLGGGLSEGGQQRNKWEKAVRTTLTVPHLGVELSEGSSASKWEKNSANHANSPSLRWVSPGDSWPGQVGEGQCEPR
jgi:hypothetical protein